MQIVILDGGTVTAGDIDFSPLEQIGQVIMHDATTKEQVVERCKDAEIVLVNKIVFEQNV